MTALIRNMKDFHKNKNRKQPSDNCWSQHPSDPWTWSFTSRLLSLTIDESVSGPLSSLSLLALPPLLPDCYFSWRRAETALQLDVVPSANMAWCIIKRCMWSPTEACEVCCSVFLRRGLAHKGVARLRDRRPTFIGLCCSAQSLLIKPQTSIVIDICLQDEWLLCGHRRTVWVLRVAFINSTLFFFFFETKEFKHRAAPQTSRRLN